MLSDEVLQLHKGLVKLLFLVVRPKDGAVLPVEYEIPARSDVRMRIVKPLQNLYRIAYGVLKNKYPPAFLLGFIPIHKVHWVLETMLHQVGQPLLDALAREREILYAVALMLGHQAVQRQVILHRMAIGAEDVQYSVGLLTG